LGGAAVKHRSQAVNPGPHQRPPDQSNRSPRAETRRAAGPDRWTGGGRGERVPPQLVTFMCATFFGRDAVAAKSALCSVFFSLEVFNRIEVGLKLLYTKGPFRGRDWSSPFEGPTDEDVCLACRFPLTSGAGSRGRRRRKPPSSSSPVSTARRRV
jgi:hypothetical protein